MNTVRALVLLTALGMANTGLAAGWLDWWLTPDQQADRLVKSGRPEEAATRYTTPERIGFAWYRAGDFERAAAAFGRSPNAEGAYNRGNALVMLGRYEEAMLSYERALGFRPEWPEALDNLALATARHAALAPPEDDAGGTGGMLAADEFVIDTSGRVDSSGTRQTLEDDTAAQSDAAMRALWLRRVERGPGEFLAVRFANQLARQQAGQRDD